jgi:hypothetical protein
MLGGAAAPWPLAGPFPEYRNTCGKARTAALNLSFSSKEEIFRVRLP